MPAKKGKKMHLEIFVDNFGEPNLNPGHWKTNPPSYKETWLFRTIENRTKDFVLNIMKAQVLLTWPLKRFVFSSKQSKELNMAYMKMMGDRFMLEQLHCTCYSSDATMRSSGTRRSLSWTHWHVAFLDDSAKHLHDYRFHWLWNAAKFW